MKRMLICVISTICLFFISSPLLAAECGQSKDKNLYPIKLPQTGQKESLTTQYGICCDDGDLREGVVWPRPRFVDNKNGTVTDRLTNLIWLKDMNCFGAVNFLDALQNCNALQSGKCGLTDRSRAGDWRMPNRNELLSLADIGNTHVPLPNFLPYGHPFINVQEGFYWTSTTALYNYPAEAWVLSSGDASVVYKGKNNSYECLPNLNCSYFFVVPVRSRK